MSKKSVIFLGLITLLSISIILGTYLYKTKILKKPTADLNKPPQMSSIPSPQPSLPPPAKMPATNNQPKVEGITESVVNEIKETKKLPEKYPFNASFSYNAVPKVTATPSGTPK